MLQIPMDRLASDVLDGLIEEFVTRQGTDLTEAATKTAQVRAQLRSGEVMIVWDEKSQTANIVPKDAKETPAPQRDLERRIIPAEQGRHIEYDEPAPPDMD